MPSPRSETSSTAYKVLSATTTTSLTSSRSSPTTSLTTSWFRLGKQRSSQVLLGEGYYAERTSKQAIEILQRRGKSLDSQVDSLEAMIKDLEAEASFFNSTASEAAEGLVEIREDYEEEDSNGGESKPGPLKQVAFNFENAMADDGEYARILSRLDELEKEELAAEIDNQSHENEEPIDDNLQNLEDFHQGIPLDQTNNNIIATESTEKNNHQEDIANQLNFASLAMESKVRDGKSSEQNVESIDRIEKLPILPKQKTVQATTASNIEVPNQTSEPSFDSSKAFTGSIIEHAENVQTTSREQRSTSLQVPDSQYSKPVSRFKMQRR
ncbi:uncharacterized protein LOC133312746 isoform X2 [Gastrolobium bilobum]|uniref:uncharacterized protein LOC133312746 isoform X2 n=1 Tax=Gastrolobium bilobum TaxID=150636 RepID=UPI002AB27DFD|nr:uncharacterized protein LOC133312746 isoform X2 [Gastrolobium bilobum]